jgi:hypothetical protein
MGRKTVLEDGQAVPQLDSLFSVTVGLPQLPLPVLTRCHCETVLVSDWTAAGMAHTGP